MSADSYIISGVVIALLLLSAWFLVNFNNVNHSLDAYEQSRRNFELNKAAWDIGEILSVTEPGLKMTIGELLGEIVYQRDGKVMYRNQELDVERKISDLLDSIYGKDNYYLEVFPPKVKVRLVFVIDGSRSLADDLENISNVIPNIEDYFKDQELAIETIIYILKENEEVSCRKINVPQAKCIDSGFEEFNNKFGPPVNYCAQIKKDSGLYNKYFVDTLKNPYSEYYLEDDMISVNTYKDDAYYCISKGELEFPNYKRFLRGFYYEDWATGVAYAVKDMERKQLNSPDPVLTLIFPVSDELSTGSESDATFSKKIEGSKWKYYERRLYYSVCDSDLIDQNRLKRADKTIKHAISVLKDTDYRVVPIFTSPDYPITINLCNDKGQYWPYLYEERSNCCGKAFCSECDAVKGTHTSDYLVQEIKKDMQELATATKGNLIDLSGGYDIEYLQGVLLETITSITNKKFVFGTLKGEERYSVNRAIPLRGNRAVTFNFWVYKEKKPHNISPVSGFNLSPVAKAFADTYKATLSEGSVVVNFWGNAFSPSGDNVKAEWFLGDEKIHEGLSFEKSFNEAGEYEVTLKVSDSSGNTSSDSVKVVIVPDFSPP